MISKDSRSPAWRVNQSLQPKSRNNEELDRLAQAIVKEIKAKRHARDLPDLHEHIKSDPDWRKIIRDDTATGAMNALVSLGGTVSELEYVFRKMYILDRSLFLPKGWGNFLDNQTGETNRGLMRRHLDYPAGTYPKNRPKKGFVFECTRPLKGLGNDDYFHVIGTWVGSPNQEKIFPSIVVVKNSEEEKLKPAGYLPILEDLEKAYRNIAPKMGVEVKIEAILNQIEKDCLEAGRQLDVNWRSVTETNIAEEWIRKKE